MRLVLILNTLFVSLIPVVYSQDTLPASAPAILDVEEAAQAGCMILLKTQEGEGPSQWPYEGVYRVRGKIPVGYEVGGTAISALALIESPNFAGDQTKADAVKRAVEFILKTLSDPLMSSGFVGTYDVRGWGHTYALILFCRLKATGLIPKGLEDKVMKSTRWLVKTLEETAIPENGGWNYARGRGFASSENNASPFMTAPTLQALFMASSLGIPVSRNVVRSALDSLDRGRTETSAYDYASLTADGIEKRREREKAARNNPDQRPSRRDAPDQKPGAIGRMVAAETTLTLAGRGDPARLLEAVRDFFEHWDNLEIRRKKTGTHEPPYGVAPYYFIYAHYYAAQAIELLESDNDRVLYRRKLNEVLTKVREPSGGWNDRVFQRSENFGTAMAIMALRMKDIPLPPRWTK